MSNTATGVGSKTPVKQCCKAHLRRQELLCPVVINYMLARPSIR